jgi:hypothetical protein
MERRQIINRQGWNDATLIHLMEFFIESRDLGDEFTEYLRATADEESAETDTDEEGETTRRESLCVLCAVRQMLMNP